MAGRSLSCTAWLNSLLFDLLKPRYSDGSVSELRLENDDVKAHRRRAALVGRVVLLGVSLGAASAVLAAAADPRSSGSLRTAAFQPAGPVVHHAACSLLPRGPAWCRLAHADGSCSLARAGLDPHAVDVGRAAHLRDGRRSSCATRVRASPRTGVRPEARGQTARPGGPRNSHGGAYREARRLQTAGPRARDRRHSRLRGLSRHGEELRKERLP